MLIQTHHYLVRPDATNFDVSDPRHLFELVAHAVQINLEEALLDERRDTLLNRFTADIAQLALHADLGNRPVGVGQQALAQVVKTNHQPNQQHRPDEAFQAREVRLRQALRKRLRLHQAARTPLHGLARGTAASGLRMAQRGDHG